MSFAVIMRKASVDSQGILAQMQGMAAGAAGNFMYNGKKGTCVFGAAQIVELPQASGGYRRRAELPATVTRDQVFAFEPKTRFVRLESTNKPSVTYIIDRIDEHDPLIRTLTLVKTGP